MPDFLSTSQRSALMSRIRGKNTKIERRMFSLLRKCNVRFGKHLKSLPGCPDIVIRSGKLVVFVDGDFWHGRALSKWRHKLAPFWLEKIQQNIARDLRRRRELRKLGWKVIRLWGKDVLRKPETCLERILRALTPVKTRQVFRRVAGRG